MLNEKELFRQIEALDPNDPQLIEKMEALNEALRGQTTDAETLAILDTFSARIAGARLHTWLPRGAVRKLIMLGILVFAVFGAVNSRSLYWLLLLLALPTFSPRAMGETFVFIARFRR